MFWKKSKQTNHNQCTIPKDSIDAMFAEADRQGWMPGRNLGTIPELVSIYKNASDYFMNMIEEADPEKREALTYHTCRYLFAKGVEGVIIWGLASGKQISVYFHPKHLVSDVETEVPPHLHQTVIDSMSIGESLFKAHQKFVIQSYNENIEVDLREEISKTIQWIGRFGISYALFHKYEALR